MLGSSAVDQWLEMPLPFRALTVVIVLFAPIAWLVMGIRAASVRRQNEGARPVPLSMIDACVGEVVETTGTIVPGPEGLVRSPMREEEGVYAMRSVSVWTYEWPADHGNRMRESPTERRWMRSSQDVDRVPARRACFGIQDGMATVWTEPDDWERLPCDVVDEGTMHLDSAVGAQREQRVYELVVRAGTRVSVRGKVERRDDGTLWLVPYSGQRLVQPDVERQREEGTAALHARMPRGPFDALRRLIAAKSRPHP